MAQKFVTAFAVAYKVLMMGKSNARLHIFLLFVETPDVAKAYIGCRLANFYSAVPAVNGSFRRRDVIVFC